MHSLVPQIYGDGRPPLHKEKLHHIRELARDLGVATSAPRIPVDPPLLRHVYLPPTHLTLLPSQVQSVDLAEAGWGAQKLTGSWIDVPHLQQ